MNWTWYIGVSMVLGALLGVMAARYDPQTHANPFLAGLLVVMCTWLGPILVPLVAVWAVVYAVGCVVVWGLRCCT